MTPAEKIIQALGIDPKNYLAGTVSIHLKDGGTIIFKGEKVIKSKGVREVVKILKTFKITEID